MGRLYDARRQVAGQYAIREVRLLFSELLQRHNDGVRLFAGRTSGGPNLQGPAIAVVYIRTEELARKKLKMSRLPKKVSLIGSNQVNYLAQFIIFILPGEDEIEKFFV
jgi:hypothetical protein